MLTSKSLCSTLKDIYYNLMVYMLTEIDVINVGSDHS